METLTWLLRMTFVEIGVIPYLFLAMPLVAAVAKRQAIPSALGLTAVVLAAPMLVLVWSAFVFGQGRDKMWVQLVPLVIVLAGILGTSIWLRRVKPRPPAWAIIAGVLGALPLWGISLFVGGMAIVNDWV